MRHTPEHIPAALDFRERYGISLEGIAKLQFYARRAKTCNEHFSNGDRSPKSFDDNDKNENSHFWGAEVDAYTEAILKLVQPFGFTAVEYTGLRPCLKRGDQFVEIP